MIKRKAILIAGDSMGCDKLKQSIDTDLKRIKSFLMSGIGGNWDNENEIKIFSQKTTEKLIQYLSDISLSLIHI